MDWKSLKSALHRDPDLPHRAFELQALSRVRDGQHYEHLATPFSDERSPSGEYVPMAQRRPACQTNLCALVVSNSVSLLFSEQHFPGWMATDAQTLAMLEDLSKHTRLNEIMIDAALRGSVGSVVLWLRILNHRPYLKVLETPYLTPSYDPNAPDTLISVVERYKVDASELIERGYAVEPGSGQYWFQRRWDQMEETWYQPLPVGEPGALVVDAGRSQHHGLGFLPMLWIKNLPGPSAHGSDYDGACTFHHGISTVIELDYLISQGNRGLKYASDPTLVLKGSETPAAHSGGAANAIILPEAADAKLLEISGGAAHAVLEQCKHLRELALESMAGIRTAPERIVGATSGRAMEMLHTPTLWLADKLRVNYGEIALVALARMICQASRIVPLIVAEQRYTDLDPAGIGLRWGQWFDSTPLDAWNQAQAIAFFVENEVLSRETATRIVSAMYDIEDVAVERGLVATEAKQQDQRELALTPPRGAAPPPTK